MWTWGYYFDWFLNLKCQRAIIYSLSSSLGDSAWCDAERIDLLTQKDRQQNLRLFLSWPNWLILFIYNASHSIALKLKLFLIICVEDVCSKIILRNLFIKLLIFNFINLDSCLFNLYLISLDCHLLFSLASYICLLEFLAFQNSMCVLKTWETEDTACPLPIEQFMHSGTNVNTYGSIILVKWHLCVQVPSIYLIL